MRTLCSAVLAGMTAVAAAAAEEAGKAEIPVTKVILFSSGVGYFEHSGAVEGDATTVLSFKAEQINDVLKSMVVMDEAGTVTSVNYASRDPLIRALKSFAVDVSDNPSLGELLTQLRGAEAVIMTPEKVTGRILGVERREKSVTTGGATTLITETILNVVTEGGIRAIPLDTVQSLSLTDEKLRVELGQALELLSTSRDVERRLLEIHFSGKGKRNARIGYIAETPVWKTSYRLELSGEKPLLQGWAILENTSDLDWKQVSLALVSGRPISFVQDLYTPLYATRPVVVPEAYASLRPPTYEEGIEKPAELLALAAEPKAKYDRARAEKEQACGAGEGYARKAMAMAAPAAPPRVAYANALGAIGQGADLSVGVQSVATATKLGELFQFLIQAPVDLQRRRSAMLPIVNKPVQAEKVSIYNANVLAKNPLNGVYLVNDTGMKLLGGPITVFADRMYAGDAQLDNMAVDEKRLLSYAVDLSVTVDASLNSSSEMASAKIVRGVLEIRHLTTFIQTYRVNNKDEAARVMIIEHPFYAPRELVEPKAYEEKTASLYRFRVPIQKKAVGDFVVKEQQVGPVLIGILDRPVGEIMIYVNNQAVPQAVRDALGKAVGMKNELSKIEIELQNKQAEKQAIEAGQDRLRRNIESVGKDSTAGKDYIAKLVAQEKQIEELQTTIRNLQEQITQKRNQLADYLKDLNVG
jgi:hypothetical protein